MGDSEHIYVTDTNIWIDLYAGGIIQDALRLPFQFVAPDVVVEELKRPEGRSLTLLGLREEELTGDEVRLVVQLANKYPAPSRADLFSLALAKAREKFCSLGTNDYGRLRKGRRFLYMGHFGYWMKWLEEGS